MLIKRRKLGFALGAGGSRGVAHIGFLQAMEEAGIKPDFISGCSMGSIVGAAYASGMSPAQMQKAVMGLRFMDLFDVTAKPGGVLDTRKIRKLLEKYIGDIYFDDLKIPFTCVAVDMVSQQLVEFSSGKVLDAIIASSSIPSVFKPMEKDGMRLVDGGVLQRVPVQQVKNMGAEKVVAVDVLGKISTKEKCPNTIIMLSEVISLMDNYRTARTHSDTQNIIDLWIEPDLGDISQYSFKNIPFAYEKGYQLGVAYTAEIKDLIRLNSPRRIGGNKR